MLNGARWILTGGHMLGKIMLSTRCNDKSRTLKEYTAAEMLKEADYYRNQGVCAEKTEDANSLFCVAEFYESGLAKLMEAFFKDGGLWFHEHDWGVEGYEERIAEIVERIKLEPELRQKIIDAHVTPVWEDRMTSGPVTKGYLDEVIEEVKGSFNRPMPLIGEEPSASDIDAAIEKMLPVGVSREEAEKDPRWQALVMAQLIADDQRRLALGSIKKLAPNMYEWFNRHTNASSSGPTAPPPAFVGGRGFGKTVMANEIRRGKVPGSMWPPIYMDKESALKSLEQHKLPGSPDVNDCPICALESGQSVAEIAQRNYERRSREGRIVAGHHRERAARELGVPVDVKFKFREPQEGDRVRFLSEAGKKALDLKEQAKWKGIPVVTATQKPKSVGPAYLDPKTMEMKRKVNGKVVSAEEMQDRAVAKEIADGIAVHEAYEKSIQEQNGFPAGVSQAFNDASSCRTVYKKDPQSYRPGDEVYVPLYNTRAIVKSVEVFGSLEKGGMQVSLELDRLSGTFSPHDIEWIPPLQEVDPGATHEEKPLGLVVPGVYLTEKATIGPSTSTTPGGWNKDHVLDLLIKDLDSTIMEVLGYGDVIVPETLERLERGMNTVLDKYHRCSHLTRRLRCKATQMEDNPTSLQLLDGDAYDSGFHLPLDEAIKGALGMHKAGQPIGVTPLGDSPVTCDDIEYFMQRLCASCSIPREMLGPPLNEKSPEKKPAKQEDEKVEEMKTFTRRSDIHVGDRIAKASNEGTRYVTEVGKDRIWWALDGCKPTSDAAGPSSFALVDRYGKKPCPNESLLGMFVARGVDTATGANREEVSVVRWRGSYYEEDSISVSGGIEHTLIHGEDWRGILATRAKREQWDWERVEHGADQWQDGTYEPKKVEPNNQWDPYGLKGNLTW